MKTRRIWIVIAVILVVGVCTTTYTKRYVKERETETSMRAMAEAVSDPDTAEAGISETRAGMPFAADADPFGAAAGTEPAERAVPWSALTDSADMTVTEGQKEEREVPAVDAASGQKAEMAQGTDENGTIPASEESAAAGPVPDPGAVAPGALPERAPGTPQQEVAAPADAANVAETMAESKADVVLAGGGKDKLAVSYKNRLLELDEQIEKNRAADAEKSVGYPVKARAENELKLWEAELSGIMKVLEEQLDSEAFKELYSRQHEWQREGETKALEASKKQSGSALEEVEYTASLAESTRARAYELVKEYEAILG